MKTFVWLRWAGAIVLVAGILRLFHITQSPPSLYWEEGALGYDAYSILLTGKDHHGNPWPVVAFESFGDWKPSGYFYALLPFLKIFGLTDLAVRLPSLLAGAGIVAGIGFLAWLASESLIKKQHRPAFVLVALAIAALSPWLILFSRAAWEANVATLFITWGVIFGWQSLLAKDNTKIRFAWLFGSMLLFCAAVYTYHSARMLAPILGMFFGVWFVYQERKIPTKKQWWLGLLAPLFLVALAAHPFVAALQSPVVQQRLSETSILSDLSVIEESNLLRTETSPAFLSHVLYHRYVLFARTIVQQFFDHFRWDFLFISGDVNPRHSTQYFGLLYPFEIVFLLTGTWFVLKKMSSFARALFFIWIIFGILPAALSTASPHALRILPTAPVFLFLVSYGVWEIGLWLQRALKRRLTPSHRASWLAGSLFVVVYAVGFAAFYHNLLTVYPKEYAKEWQYGYKEMIAALEAARFKHFGMPSYVSREYGRPAMYYWFYTKTDPQLVQEAQAHSRKDQGEFLEFGNVFFINQPNEISQKPALFAASANQFEGLKVREDITIITNLKNEVVWRIAIIE